MRPEYTESTREHFTGTLRRTLIQHGTQQKNTRLGEIKSNGTECVGNNTNCHNTVWQLGHGALRVSAGSALKWHEYRAIADNWHGRLSMKYTKIWNRYIEHDDDDHGESVARHVRPETTANNKLDDGSHGDQRDDDSETF